MAWENTPWGFLWIPVEFYSKPSAPEAENSRWIFQAKTFDPNPNETLKSSVWLMDDARNE